MPSLCGSRWLVSGVSSSGKGKRSSCDYVCSTCGVWILCGCLLHRKGTGPNLHRCGARVVYVWRVGYGVLLAAHGMWVVGCGVWGMACCLPHTTLTGLDARSRVLGWSCMGVY